MTNLPASKALLNGLPRRKVDTEVMVDLPEGGFQGLAPLSLLCSHRPLVIFLQPIIALCSVVNCRNQLAVHGAE